MKILVTGGAGFIGSCFVRMVLEGKKDVEVICLDALTYSGHEENLSAVSKHPQFRFVQGDICDRVLVEKLFREARFEAVVHFAAESHVDRSIADSEQFVRTNVLGTQVLLECARHYPVKKFIQISTDEVYGELGDTGEFTEATPLQPNSPYSASKAAGDHLCAAYFRTYGVPVVITRSANNYGPYQYPEKLIPVLVHRALHNAKLPIYGKGLNVRSWIHVEDHCEAIWVILEKAKAGAIYNISSGEELTNLEVAKTVLRILGQGESQIEFVPDRPGHDWRYALNSDRLRKELGWASKKSFSQGLRETVDWYRANQNWVNRVQSRNRG